MSDVDRMIEKRAKRSPGFEAKVNAKLAELRIGLIVKELRRKKKLTQEELGACRTLAAGPSRGRVAAWRNGW